MKQPKIRLSDELIARCLALAQKIVREFAEGKWSNHLSHRNADKNVQVWFEGKMAECVFAFESGFGIGAVSFTGEPDPHWDVRFRVKRVDVKQTGPGGRYLLWPISKNGEWHKRDFDVLVLTIMREDGLGCSVGWITKEEFFAKKKIAGPNHPLDEGTWYVDRDPDLHDMASFYRDYAWRGCTDGGNDNIPM